MILTRKDSSMNSLGIDASSYDGAINWETTASRRIEFATIRATWSSRYKDGRYKINLEAARAAGINVIPYHWFVPRVDPVAQATHFALNSDDTGFYRMVDLEDSRTTFAYAGIGKDILKFQEAFFAITGQYCILYTSPVYIKTYLVNAHELVQFPLVIAHWNAAYPLVPLPFTPTDWIAWQYTALGDALYYGITQCKACSLYVWNGHLNAWNNFKP